MSLALRLLAEPVRSRGFATIGAAYMGVGDAINNKARIVYVANNTNQNLLFSFDGVNDHFVLPDSNFIQWDIASNKTFGSYRLAEGDRIYVKEITTPTSGSVYVTIFYGKDD